MAARPLFSRAETAMVVLLVLILLGSLASLAATGFRRALDIIRQEGQFIFSDGSSYYLFDGDGTFDSGPTAISGRTIRGTWKPDGDYRFVIEGEWGWVNGVSPANDRRRLVITLQPPFVPEARESARPFIPRHMKSPPKIYRCYFTLEELVKVKALE